MLSENPLSMGQDEASQKKRGLILTQFPLRSLHFLILCVLLLVSGFHKKTTGCETSVANMSKMMAKLFFLHLEVSGLHIITVTELEGVFFLRFDLNFIRSAYRCSQYQKTFTVSQKDMITDRCTRW